MDMLLIVIKNIILKYSKQGIFSAFFKREHHVMFPLLYYFAVVYLIVEYGVYTAYLISSPDL